jgi:hypothetical protein
MDWSKLTRVHHAQIGKIVRLDPATRRNPDGSVVSLCLQPPTTGAPPLKPVSE